MGYGGLAVLARDRHLENAVAVFCHGRRVAIPVVEVANEVCSQGTWCPFTVHDVAVLLDVEAKALVALVGG